VDVSSAGRRRSRQVRQICLFGSLCSLFFKCDQTAGGCNNCQKKGFECPGYRSELDLRFRDETPYVTQKSIDRENSRKNRSRLHGPKPPAASSASSQPKSVRLGTETPEGGQTPKEYLETGIILPWGHQEHRKPTPYSTLAGLHSKDFDDQALAFFFSNHVIKEWVRPSGDITESYGMDGALVTAIQASGLAGISGFIHNPHVKIEARRRYLSAVQHVNKAIVDTENATKDSTLTAILLLSQVEALDCDTSRPLAAWENHVKGAAAVLQLRGPERLRTPLELRLFVQALSSILVCCLKNHIHVPDHLFDLADAAEQYMNKHEPGWRFLRGHMRSAQLKANVFYGVITDPEIILREALAIDAMACAIFNGAGLEWQFETIVDNTHPDTIPLGYYYKYQSFVFAQTWCGMRGTRLDLHRIIRKTLLDGFNAKPPVFSGVEHTAQFLLSTNILYEMQTELLASIPQFILDLEPSQHPKPRFPWTNFESALYSPSKMAISRFGDVPLIRSISGHAHLWSLYKVADVSVSTRETRELVVRLLKQSGSEMGIQQAFVLAEELELKHGLKKGEGVGLQGPET